MNRTDSILFYFYIPISLNIENTINIRLLIHCKLQENYLSAFLLNYNHCIQLDSILFIKSVITAKI